MFDRIIKVFGHKFEIDSKRSFSFISLDIFIERARYNLKLRLQDLRMVEVFWLFPLVHLCPNTKVIQRGRISRISTVRREKTTAESS